MKKVFIAFLLAMTVFSLLASSAEARRLGGGGSVGKQSQRVTRSAPTQAAAPVAPTAPIAAPQPLPVQSASPWRGMIGGALLGLGLGAMFAHFGLGGEMVPMLSDILMIVLVLFVVIFIYRLYRRKTAEAPVYVGSYSNTIMPGAGARIEPDFRPAALQTTPSGSVAKKSEAKPWSVPANFDVPAFLRNAKTYFIRLQAAWDRADTNDMREFTTSEMFAQLKLQVQARGATPNTTEVVSLGAELLGVETSDVEYLASVKFSGMIKEMQNGPAEPFSEVWNLSKPVSGPGGWVLAGIQQLS